MSQPINHIIVTANMASYARGSNQNLSGENHLAAAQAITSAKGQENDMTSDSKEARERKRINALREAAHQAKLNESKTLGGQKSYLA